MLLEGSAFLSYTNKLIPTAVNKNKTIGHKKITQERVEYPLEHKKFNKKVHATRTTALITNRGNLCITGNAIGPTLYSLEGIYMFLIIKI